MPLVTYVVHAERDQRDGKTSERARYTGGHSVPVVVRGIPLLCPTGQASLPEHKHNFPRLRMNCKVRVWMSKRCIVTDTVDVD